MNLLLDTQIAIWSLVAPERLSAEVSRLIRESEGVWFSVVSLWETAIKRALPRHDFDVDPRVLRRTLLDDGYSELIVQADHVLAVADLPPLHKDPFDRLLLAQAKSEGILFLTADKTLARYPGPIRLV